MAIVRKTDNVIQVTINGGNGLPLVITSLADLEIVAYQLPKTIIQRWLLSDGDIDIITDASGIVNVYFDRDNTQLLNFKNDNCKLEVIATFTDANFEASIRREVDTDIQLAIIEDSPTAYEA
tara:strand:+ start:1785 stop:2150 length:366 start_codon:yes stop_codon:yes gene_type:complete